MATAMWDFGACAAWQSLRSTAASTWMFSVMPIGGSMGRSRPVQGSCHVEKLLRCSLLGKPVRGASMAGMNNSLTNACSAKGRGHWLPRRYLIAKA
jgi:hypothetical protein